MNPTGRHPIFSLLGFLTASFGVGFIGSQGALRGVGGWYQVLEKPSWNPPAWLFAPVWTLLYLLMGIAGWLVWRSNSDSKKVALALFGVQLILNAVWPWMFFAFHLLFASTIEIGILWIVIGLSCGLFFRVRNWAGTLMIPYLLWVLFAAALNYSIWRLSTDSSAIKVTIGEGTK